MSNRTISRHREAGIGLTVGLAAMLGGCVAAVVPAIVTGAVGNKVLRHRDRPSPAPVAGPETAARPVPASPLQQPPTVPAKREVRPRPAPVVVADAPPPAVRLIPPASPAPAAPVAVPPAAVASSWEAIARAMAKMAARVSDPMKIDMLAPRAAGPQHCGPRPAAMVIDTATLTRADYLYVGALYTMGMEIVLTSPLKQLPPGQIAALRRQGIAAPVAGKTLFASYPGAERQARAAIARQYCVVGLVGARAADFPDNVLPGTPGAREGWFLVRR